MIEISRSNLRHQRVHPTRVHGFALALTETCGMCFCLSMLVLLPFLQLVHLSFKRPINIFRDIDLVCMLQLSFLKAFLA